MKKKPQKSEQKTAVDRVKARISHAIPCVNADKEGYCTGPCEGSLCFKCASYQPVKPAPVVPEVVQPSALTVRMNEITFPSGVETLAEKANWLHACSIELSKRSTAAAILAGWVLSVARSTCAHGQWLSWLEQNVTFARRTADNYMTLYAQTIGAARAAARRPVALTVEPTMRELESAAHDVDGKSLSALYKSTRLIAVSDNWGGKREGAGNKKKDVAAELKAVTEHEAVIWSSAKGSLDTLVQLDAERDVFRRLTNDHLATVSGILADLAKKAEEILKQRLSGKITATLDTAEAVSILEKGL